MTIHNAKAVFAMLMALVGQAEDNAYLLEAVLKEHAAAVKGA